MKLTQTGEFGLIALIKKNAAFRPDVIRGIGDDAAVLPLNSKKHLLLTTDMLAEDVHFTRRMNPESVGHKALACNISDIAAMGGVPTYAVVSIGQPPNLSLRYVKDLYQGINRLARAFKVAVVGGDTIRSSKITINIALLGEVEKKFLVLRSGARVGDWIFTTGPLGGSLRNGKHLSFTPRVEEARFLVKNFKPSAMIDISDGLSADLGHILRESRVGAVLYVGQIPCNRVGLRQALTDGEDFELLFTLAPAYARKLLEWQIKSKRWFFYYVGEINEKRNQLMLVDQKGNAKSFKTQGYKHF